MYYQPARPAVWKWYVAYSVVMALMYLLCLIFGAILLMIGPDEMQMEPVAAGIMGLAFLGIGTLFLAAYLIGLFLPREPWAWIYHLILISIGLTGVCTLPAAIPLLIFWLKPDVKQWFGRLP